MRERDPTPPGTSSPSLPPPPKPISTTLSTPDGFALAATLYLPRGLGPFPAVLLSHMGGGSRAAWGRVPKALGEAGYAALSYDFRGHGQSAGRLDPPQAATDLETALAYLRARPEVDGRRVALVGASMGGMASVIVGAADEEVRGVVAISTSPGAAGQYPGQVVDRLSPRPFLAVGCDEDPLTRPERVRQLYEAAGPPKRLVILTCAVHANEILETDAGTELLKLLLVWLDRHLR